MSNPKILCLPPVANTLRDLDMRFTWVHMPDPEPFARGGPTLTFFVRGERIQRALKVGSHRPASETPF